MASSTIGVCTSEVVDSVCSTFVEVNNLMLDSASFDWEFFGVVTGGITLMWATGLAFGVIVKSIKKGSRL